MTDQAGLHYHFPPTPW